MKFFNIDLHVSVIEDIKNIFKYFGHEITEWSLSGHTWVMGKKTIENGIVTRQNWRNLNKQICDSFFNRYEKQLINYDGFICTYPPPFSLIYEKFNKPIIVMVPIRYEEPFGDNVEKWIWFNEFLKNGIDQRKIIPIANNKYDVEYTKSFLQRNFLHIPSLCEYTKMEYKPQLESFLLDCRGDIQIPHPKIIKKLNLGHYLWNDLTKFKGIIHIPYNCSIMKIFEQYTANIPLFFPTKRYLLELRQIYPQMNYGVLTDLSFNFIFNRPSKSVINCNSIFDPNDYQDLRTTEYWLQFSDFYDEENMPFIQYFDSSQHLFDLMVKADTNEISNKMKEFNRQRKTKILNSWNIVLNQLGGMK